MEDTNTGSVGNKSVSAADDGYMHHISLILMHTQLTTCLQSSMVLNKAVKIMGNRGRGHCKQKPPVTCEMVLFKDITK